MEHQGRECNDSDWALRIPMKWGTDSSASGAASRQATLVKAIITEVPHFRQGFCAC